MRQRFRPDVSYRRPDGGNVVIGGSPLRLFRLTGAGRRIVEAIEQGAELAPGHRTLTDRLLDGGVIHPVPGRDAGPLSIDDVTVVVPALDALPSPSLRMQTVVVDDGSEPRLVTRDPAVTMLRLERTSGPGAARNAGLATVQTELVAFVDTDVELRDGWLEPLLAHFSDPQVALAAPRVRSSPGGAAGVDAYESVRGSLDLGPLEARIAPGTRVSFVPAAAIVCRADAVREVGGFDAELRFGEDVDLVWRLHEAGWRCRYEPTSEVRHRARPSSRTWAAQRFAYGSSAAPLAQRHPGALAPLRISGWSAAVWGLVAIRRPSAAVVVAVGTAVALQRKLRGLPPAEAARLAGLGNLFAGQQVAAAITRAWWPAAALAAIIVRRARLPLAAAVLVPPVIEWVSRRRGASRPGHEPGPDHELGPTLARYVVMRVADDVAYGAGVWAGSVRRWQFAALVPDLTNWPPKRDREPVRPAGR
ncbi:MAG: Mycofactocin system glycosyltransferase [Ilumatobacteraceae bacterium]|nr:Mycofactocin system glycosyltransferase [Ilumatobacteraceae bacterium]